MTSEAAQPSFFQRGARMVFHVVTIQIREESLQPFVHDLVIFPSFLQFREENAPALARFGLEGGQGVLIQIVINRFTVALVQLTRPIVWRSLGTHIVACSGNNGGVRHDRAGSRSRTKIAEQYSRVNVDVFFRTKHGGLTTFHFSIQHGY